MKRSNSSLSARWPVTTDQTIEQVEALREALRQLRENHCGLVEPSQPHRLLTLPADMAGSSSSANREGRG